MFCMRCGNPVGENNKFCTRCGAEIVQVPMDTEAVEEPAADEASETVTVIADETENPSSPEVIEAAPVPQEPVETPFCPVTPEQQNSEAPQYVTPEQVNPSDSIKAFANKAGEQFKAAGKKLSSTVQNAAGSLTVQQKKSVWLTSQLLLLRFCF